ncbi:hypothetical protein Tco_0336900 [Tanacetum coccineum]
MINGDARDQNGIFISCGEKIWEGTTGYVRKARKIHTTKRKRRFVMPLMDGFQHLEKSIEEWAQKWFDFATGSVNRDRSELFGGQLITVRAPFPKTYTIVDKKDSSERNTGTPIDQGVGSTSGIRACALRNFNLEVTELANSQNNALAKLPMLKLGEYEMWEIRIKQYFQIQDYTLWEVIENGNSWVPIPVTTPESGPSTALKMTVPSIAEE